MNIFLLVLYLILLLLVAAYGGIIAYHVFKYKNQLPDNDIKTSMRMLWMYLLVASVIILVSLTSGFIYWWFV